MPSTGVRGDSAGCGAVDVAGVVLVDLSGLVAGVVGVVVEVVGVLEVVVPEGADVPVARLGVPEFCVVELDGLVVDGFIVPVFVVSGLVVSGLVELVDFDRFLDHIHCLPSIVFSGFREGFGRAVDAGPPLVGLVLAAELLERGRVSTVERRRPRVGGRGIELWNLQLAQRGCGIPEVQTRAGHRDREFDLHRRLECGAINGPPELEGTLRTAETALAVHHHRELVVPAGDPPVRAELPESRREVTEPVRRDRRGLTYDSHTTGTTSGAQCVLVRFFRVRVDEERRGDEVTRDPVRVVLAEGLELSTSSGVEVASVDLVRDLRVVVTRADRPGAVRVAVFPVVTRSLAEPCTGRAVAVAESFALGSTIPRGTVVVATERTVVAATAERTVTITTRSIVVPTERTVSASTADRAVTITTGTVIPATERTISAGVAHGTFAVATGTVVAATERTVVATAAERTVTITTRTVITPTERTVTITTRTVVVPTERTVPITTGPIVVPTERTVTGSTAGRTVTVTTRTVVASTERTVPITTGPIVVPTERTVTGSTAGRTVTVTTRTVVASTERTVPIATGPIVVPTERTVTGSAAGRTVTVTTRTVVASTSRTVAITTRPIVTSTERTVTITTRTVRRGTV
ncbi:hypothetical protein [Curtobacterium herbarum]|uniref:hypothetical protein n=1 Tax=Curtobacterium herbarum TaxID=150122 RepID=UPI001EF7F84C|nr:hypothetical protein [Curtobacterium herbarum]MBM7474323.1 RNase P/RNase MRP subunit p29 [Curtobacterium herbarum]MCS6545710.1 hypothetical protein [Curtobacterium herbarum]